MAVAERVSERVERLRASLEEPLLVTTGVNVRYLTGFNSSNVALFVDEERVLLFTDFRYAEAARAVEGAEFVQTQRSVLKTVAETLDGNDRLRGIRVDVRRLGDAAEGGLELVPRNGLVERLRAVKDESELAAIREAARITDQAYAAFAEERFVGRTERDLAWRMEQLFHEHGAHGIAFELIVGSGPTGALPHGRPTDRVVEPNTTVVVDAGCVFGGYNSDCTRTFATGDLPDDLAQAYDVCLRGQLAGLDAMRAGVSRRGGGRGGAARDRRRRLRREVRPRARPRSRPARPRGADGATRVDGRARAGQRDHVRAGHLPRRDTAACGSRTSCSSPTASRRTSTRTRRSS